MSILVKDILAGVAGRDPGEAIDVFMAGEAVDLAFGPELGGVGVEIQVTAIPPFQLVGVVGSLDHNEMNTILSLLLAHAQGSELTARWKSYIEDPRAAAGVVLGDPTE